MKMKKIPHKKILILMLIIIILIPFCLYQNKHLVITTYTYESEKLGADLDGYRIVQISDLHNAAFGKENKKLLETIRSCSPDIIVITGDLVDSNDTNVERAVAFVKEAVKIAPVYYVTGNHEYWLEPSENEQMMQGILAAGACDLDDEAVCIETLKNLLQEQKNELSIVLAHEPQYLQNYANAGADLVLTGHAHGGQIRLPFVGGIVAPDQGFLPEYTSGKYNRADTEMIVSRGLGNSIIPVRLFNYPEVVCVELRCKN